MKFGLVLHSIVGGFMITNSTLLPSKESATLDDLLE
jgi:hypothetical protein